MTYLRLLILDRFANKAISNKMALNFLQQQKGELVQIKNCLSEDEASQFLVWLTAELEALKRLV